MLENLVLGGTLLMAFALVGCASKSPPERVVVDRIIKAMSELAPPARAGAATSSEGDQGSSSSEEPEIQSLLFFTDRLSVGDIVVRSPMAAAATADEIEAAAPASPLQKILSVCDAISNYEALSAKEREILAARWERRMVDGFVQDFPIGVSRLEFSAISRLHDDAAAEDAAWKLIKKRRDLELGITSGLESLVDGALDQALVDLANESAKELMTDSRGRVSAGNFRRLRRQMAENLKEARTKIEAGELVYLIGKVGFAERVLIDFEPALDELGEEDLAVLGVAGKTIFSAYPDLAESPAPEGSGVLLQRDPRIFWGFVGYRLVVDEAGELSVDLEQPLHLDEEMAE